jgi:hypothetical protein
MIAFARMRQIPVLSGQPLSLELLEGKPKAFSARVLARLSNNPLFKPKRAKDGAITDHDMLTIAATVVSVADERIEELERKSSVLNGPMFSAAKPVSEDETAAPDESNWFLRYLTLRNFLSAALAIIAGLWGFFTYTTSDKNFQLESKQKDIEGLQKETKFWQDQAKVYKDQSSADNARKTEAEGKLQGLQGTEEAERKELAVLRIQVQDLTKAVQKQATAAAVAAK